MKRILVTILTVLYMVSATGATIHIHYCMGKVMGARFSHHDEEMCTKCGMKKSMSKGCCKDEHKTIKASDHQFAKAHFDFSHQDLATILPNTYPFASSQYYSSASSADEAAMAHAPPSLWRTCPIYIQVQNFRI